MHDDDTAATGEPVPPGIYTGHVEPGGRPAWRRAITTTGTTVEIRKRSVGPMDNNAYLIVDVDKGAALLVDAAARADLLHDLVGDLDLTGIVTTHHHADHRQALSEVAGAFDVPVLAGAEDAAAIDHAVARRLRHGDVVPVGALTLEVLHTPGHTPGSICLLLRADSGETSRHLFTGDTLFPGGPGNTFGDAAAFGEIMTSLRERVFTLPDDTWVYPGHGDDTTISRERPSLDDWQARGW